MKTQTEILTPLSKDTSYTFPAKAFRYRVKSVFVNDAQVGADYIDSITLRQSRIGSNEILMLATTGQLPEANYEIVFAEQLPCMASGAVATACIPPDWWIEPGDQLSLIFQNSGEGKVFDGNIVLVYEFVELP